MTKIGPVGASMLAETPTPASTETTPQVHAEMILFFEFEQVGIK